MKKLTLVAALLAAAVQAAPAHAASFLFIRHAESTTNAGSATTVEEFVNPPLTVLGQQQALDLVGTLASYDISTIYTSAYQRTQLTIAPTAAAHGLTPITDARTNEWYFGDATNISELSLAGLGGVIGAWRAGNPDAQPALPNAESLTELAARVVPAWQEIVERHKDDAGYVVLVGHGAETGYVMPYFAKNVTSSFAFANGMRNTGIIELDLVDGQPYVTNWQGTAMAVPESSTWAMMAAGIVLLAGLRRTTRRAAPGTAAA